jgi:hypothetical protein
MQVNEAEEVGCLPKRQLAGGKLGDRTGSLPLSTALGRRSSGFGGTGPLNRQE